MLMCVCICLRESGGSACMRVSNYVSDRACVCVSERVGGGLACAYLIMCPAVHVLVCVRACMFIDKFTRML